MLDHQHLKQLILAILVCAVSFSETIPKLQYHTMQVFGNSSLGYYYTNIYVGTPPQPQSVIIDTASSTLSIPCNVCKNCNNNRIYPLFNMSSSSTCKTITCASPEKQFCQDSCQGDVEPTKPCQFDIFYAQGSSLKGIYLKDVIQLQKDSVGESAQVFFGCTVNETNKFVNQSVNGIMGLSPYKNYLINSFYEQHYINSNQKKQISICLSRNGGGLFIGGYEKSLTNSQVPPIKGTINNLKNFYGLNTFTDAMIGNTIFHQAKNYPDLNAFIDSGSTFTYLPDQSYENLLKVLDYVCKIHMHCNVASQTQNYEDPQRCYQLSHIIPNALTRARFEEIVDSIFPSIYFEISRTPIQWKPTEYFLLRDIDNRQICLGIGPLKNQVILGANWMVNKNIVLDIENLNFAIHTEINCAYPQRNQMNRIKNQQYQSKMGLLLEKQTGNEPLFHQSKSVFIPVEAMIKIFAVIATFIILVGILVFFLRKRHDKIIQQSINKNTATTSAMEEQQDQHSQLSIFKNKRYAENQNE